MNNQSPSAIFRNAVRASLGLFAFGFGDYLSIVAGIGAGPWEAFTLGLSDTLRLSYGTVAVSMSLIIVLVNILLKERIGIGMLLDAVIVGLSVDLFLALDLIKVPDGIIGGVLLMLAGLLIMGFSVYFYMAAFLGCGPRDCLMVALSKRMRRISIGTVNMIMMVSVTAAGYLLGGPIGIGTLMCAFLSGPFMQLAFKIFRFNATDAEHQGIFETLRVLFGKR